MFAVILAKLTAPSSTLPKCPTVNILATVREYCSTNVTTKGLEYLHNVFASRRHVVLIFPEATAASHCAFSRSCRLRDDSTIVFPNKAEVSEGSAVKSGAAASSSTSDFGIFVLNNRLYNRFKALLLGGSGCFGGITWLSLKRLRSSSLDCFFSFFVRYFTSWGWGAAIAGRVPPNATKLGLRYELAIECCSVSGRTVEDPEDSSSELGLSLSGASISSSGHSARSRAIDSWAIGEAER